MKFSIMKTALTVLSLHSIFAFSQTIPYGAPISLEDAKKAAQAASAEMHKNNFDMTIAVVDSGGNLVYLERSNNAGLGTIDPAIGKAKAANGIKTPTKAIADMIVKQGVVNLIAVPGAMPVDGGVPIIVDNKVIGAIGVSGGMLQDDDAVATIGAQSLLH
ncbi:GlcG/HbpS family heme-binding protein [Marinomonas shanghaiensis]|uniref:GlcG/HbpS family heme-binding protein n=1 Tax=Marinomonas shanghaiensis TaxID=2202418 RepID=UPI003A92E350